MRYDSKDLQNLLAAEYALGNLRGAARRRMGTLMRRDHGLRRRVEQWEEHLFPLLLRSPRVSPPARVWRNIHARITRRRDQPSWLERWRRLVWAATALTAAALLLLVVLPRPAPEFTSIAVLNDVQGQPSILVSWTGRQAHERQLRVRIVAHPDMPAGTSWEAWLVRDTNEPPLSLGLVGADEHQVLVIPAAVASELQKGRAIGVTVEPKLGSPTGRPSGPYLFQGPVFRLDS